MLGRAALSGRSRAHAYLMLLRMEVTAFHPATPAGASPGHLTEVAVRVRHFRAARLSVSSLWPCSSACAAHQALRMAGRPLAVILPCGVRTFLAVQSTPRLP